MKDSKNLPSDELPDPEYDALLEKLGLMHIGEALQADGEIILLRDQTLMELKEDLISNIDNLSNKPQKEVMVVIKRIFKKHARRFENRSNIIMRKYFSKKIPFKKKNNL
jgi:hypothetical protein